MNITEKKFDVLVAGELNPDLILSDPNLQPEFGQHEILVENSELTIGSSSAIYACGAARLGLKVAFIGVVGKDDFGKFMINALQDRGVDTSHVIVDQEEKTGLSVILNRGEDRAILTYLGVIDALQAEHISDDLLDQCRHLHVASYFLQNQLRPRLKNLFVRAKAKGLSISLDTNWDPAEKWQGVEQLLPLVDVFMPNENEAFSLTGESTVDDALASLARHGSLTAMKLGADGAIARKGNEIKKTSSIQIAEIADTVGAGDSFDAGFTYGYLQGWELKKTLQLASVCGSLSLREHGGTKAQAELSEALRLITDLDK